MTELPASGEDTRSPGKVQVPPKNECLFVRPDSDLHVVQTGKTQSGPEADLDLRAGRHIARGQRLRAGVGEASDGQGVCDAHRIVDRRAEIEVRAVPGFFELESQRNLAGCGQTADFLRESDERGLRLAQRRDVGDKVTGLVPYRIIGRTFDRHCRAPSKRNAGIPAIGPLLQPGQIAEVTIGHLQGIVGRLCRCCPSQD